MLSDGGLVIIAVISEYSGNCAQPFLVYAFPTPSLFANRPFQTVKHWLD